MSENEEPVLPIELLVHAQSYGFPLESLRREAPLSTSAIRTALDAAFPAWETLPLEAAVYLIETRPALFVSYLYLTKNYLYWGLLARAVEKDDAIALRRAFTLLPVDRLWLVTKAAPPRHYPLYRQLLAQLVRQVPRVDLSDLLLKLAQLWNAPGIGLTLTYVKAGELPDDYFEQLPAPLLVTVVPLVPLVHRPDLDRAGERRLVDYLIVRSSGHPSQRASIGVLLWSILWEAWPPPDYLALNQANIHRTAIQSAIDVAPTRDVLATQTTLSGRYGRLPLYYWLEVDSSQIFTIFTALELQYYFFTMPQSDAAEVWEVLIYRGGSAVQGLFLDYQPGHSPAEFYQLLTLNPPLFGDVLSAYTRPLDFGEFAGAVGLLLGNLPQYQSILALYVQRYPAVADRFLSGGMLPSTAALLVPHLAYRDRVELANLLASALSIESLAILPVSAVTAIMHQPVDIERPSKYKTGYLAIGWTLYWRHLTRLELRVTAVHPAQRGHLLAEQVQAWARRLLADQSPND